MEVDDLVDLTPPTTDNLLRVLHRRFKRDLVHTRLGPSHLLSLNPYRSLRLAPAEPPQQLLDGLKLRLIEGLETRSLLLPIGESGSGKTTCFMDALLRLSRDSDKRLGLGVELLRALGNARTSRNDDASRFVLLVEMGFDFRGYVTCSVIHTYMLEKSLVTSRTNPNFHIFYAILSGADPHLLKSLRLSRSADSYAILQQTPSNAHNGKEAFDSIRNCLSTHGMDEKTFLQILAAILKLGNVFFIPVTRMDGTGGIQLEPRGEFLDACSLLGVDAVSLETCLLSHHPGPPGDCAGAGALRDGLLRALYSRLFMFVTTRVSKGECPQSRSITLLDTPGFQTLENNSFNQLVINLTSEKTQEILVDNILKEKQEELVREGFQWVKVDTRGVVGNIFDGIEKNGPLCQNKTDEEALDLILDCSPFASRLGVDAFRIRHFAGTVTYNKAGLPEKSDTLPKSLSVCMYEGSHPWMKEFFPEGSSTHSPGKPLTQLSHLYLLTHKLRSLASCTPYTIHCIKPNELKQPSLFEPALVLHQLKYHRIMDTLTVIRDGFSYNSEFDKFVERYKLLSLLTWPRWDGSAREGVVLILSDLVLPQEEFYIGRSRVFLKDNVLCDLETYRRERLEDLALLIQKTWRGWKEFNKWRKLRQAQTTIGREWRKFMCKRNEHAEQERNRRKIAVGKIQRAYLHWKRKAFLKHLATQPLPMSPISKDWPLTPHFLHETSFEIRKIFHRWRCFHYRARFSDTNEKNRMGEKLTAANLLKGRKANYAKSVSHPFLGDYVRLRSNSEWRRVAKQDNSVVFADIVNKISRSGGKPIPALLAVSTHSLLVLDPRTLSLKERLPVQEILKLSLSPFSDTILIVHRIRNDAFDTEDRPLPCTGCSLFDTPPGKRGDLIISTDHVIELTTKLYLVTKNHSGGKGPAVDIRETLEANFTTAASTRVNFIRTGSGESSEGVHFKIVTKQGKMDIYL